jgi:putative oxidoreductase
LTPLAAIPLIINISVAIAATKTRLGIQKGFWAAAHEARTDFAMLLGAIFLLIAGAKPLPIDRMLGKVRDNVTGK